MKAPMTRVIFLPGMMCDQQLWQEVWSYLPDQWNLQYVALENCASRDAMKALIGNNIAQEI
ncbi:MAG: hypothetical protein MK052_07500, partial [Alphaproteobacteria bacterium]|nr:hypothetical protein [Alphaproteobacteria bacterium]